MSIELPKLTIGLPVYNGEQYLPQVLDSIINQTFSDFKIIISDNGSTDATASIYQKYAKRDNRIKYHRYPDNRGAAWNFNNVFNLSDSKYFKWAAADDVCSLDLYAKCISALDSDPSVNLAFGSIINIDENGKESRESLYDQLINAAKPDVRFNYMINSDPSCMAVFGIFRSAVLKHTSLIGNYPSSDKSLLAQICLSGRMNEISDSFFYRRVHSNISCSVYPSEYSRSEWFDPANDGKVVFPGWRLLIEYIKSVKIFGSNIKIRIFCYVHITKWIFSHLPYLIKNVIVYILHLLFKPGFYEAKNRSYTIKSILKNHIK